MKLKSLLTASFLTLGAMANSQAITFTFVPTSVAGGGTFTAEVTFPDSVINQGFINQIPTSFLATISGSPFSANRSWEQDEISFSQFQVTSGRVLTYNALQATDNDTAGLQPFLNGGPTGFSSPTTIGGSWVEKVTTSRVPETLPAAFAPALLAACAFVARVFSSKR